MPVRTHTHTHTHIQHFTETRTTVICSDTTRITDLPGKSMDPSWFVSPSDGSPGRSAQNQFATQASGLKGGWFVPNTSLQETASSDNQGRYVLHITQPSVSNIHRIVLQSIV